MTAQREFCDHGMVEGQCSVCDATPEEIAALRKENEEQAHLLGMSGSHEAKLLAELETEKKWSAAYRKVAILQVDRDLLSDSVVSAEDIVDAEAQRIMQTR